MELSGYVDVCLAEKHTFSAEKFKVIILNIETKKDSMITFSKWTETVASGIHVQKARVANTPFPWENSQ